MNDTIFNDRYQIRKQLSTKPGRRIFMAQDLQSGNLVIVKILLFDPDFKWKEHELFEREAQTLKNLDHPAIPKYLDYFDVSTNNYHGFALVQTYIDAPSLESLIQDGRKFSENELVELADKILSILDYLHQQNPIVIHRDIKPSNILLTNRSGNSVGEIYLVDFGCVQTTASKEYGTITVVGTYGYIPPEQFGGKAVAASDLYSLGMTIIYLAKGIHPAELSQVNGQYKIEMPQLSKRFQKWLEKMININLDQRFSSAQVAQEFLRSNDAKLSYYPEFKPTSTKINICYNDDQAEIILLDQITNIYEIFLLILSQILICILSPLFWFISFFISIFLAQLISTISSFALCLCLNVIFNVVNQIKDERIFKIIIDDNSQYLCQNKSLQKFWQNSQNPPHIDV